VYSNGTSNSCIRLTESACSVLFFKATSVASASTLIMRMVQACLDPRTWASRSPVSCLPTTISTDESLLTFPEVISASRYPAIVSRLILYVSVVLTSTLIERPSASVYTPSKPIAFTFPLYNPFSTV
jgi:hypothetical protein